MLKQRVFPLNSEYLKWLFLDDVGAKMLLRKYMEDGEMIANSGNKIYDISRYIMREFTEITS